MPWSTTTTRRSAWACRARRSPTWCNSSSRCERSAGGVRHRGAPPGRERGTMAGSRRSRVESIQGLLDFGWWLRLVAVATYAAAFVGYAARLAVQKLKLDRAATALAALAVTVHTAYLVTRWVAAGRIEILARQATGDVLSSTDRFWFMVSHPPYTNLFDALNFVAWAMMVCYLIIERKWGLRIVGVLAVALALVAMGEASLVTDKQIEPLVPALQSYWILIHVGMLLAAGAVVYFRARKGPEQGVHARGYKIVAAGFALLTLGLALLVYRILGSHEIVLPEGARLATGEHGPFRLGLASNYALGLIALVWGTTLGFLLTTPLRDRISATLPDPRKLEDITYRVIIAGWPLLTVGIVMGGMWANEAWGRFWGWDPKETWALITWVVYAGYLHTRITLGWAGKRPAAIAVFAFAVVVFTFMGVNLGLTGEGLHTYGSG